MMKMFAALLFVFSQAYAQNSACAGGRITAERDEFECICPENTFGANVSFVDVDPSLADCVPCPNNRETDGATGVNDVTGCLCPAGEEFAGGGGINDACKSCDVGFFSEEFSAECVDCHLNVVGDVTTNGLGSTSFEDCVCAPGTLPVFQPPDSFASIDFDLKLASCLPCPFHRDTVGETAQNFADCLCPAGEEFASDGGPNDACKSCDVGFFSEGLSAECVPCANSFTTDGLGSTSPDDCSCGPGSFLVTLPNAAPFCDLCPPGTAKPNAGNEGCTPCEIGFYSNGFSGYVNCEACPDGSTTLAIGTTTVDNCECAADFEGIGPNDCEACPDRQTAAVGNDAECNFPNDLVLTALTCGLL